MLCKMIIISIILLLTANVGKCHIIEKSKSDLGILVVNRSVFPTSTREATRVSIFVITFGFPFSSDLCMTGTFHVTFHF